MEPVIAGASGLVRREAWRDSSVISATAAHTGTREARLEGRAGQRINFVLL